MRKIALLSVPLILLFIWLFFSKNILGIFLLVSSYLFMFLVYTYNITITNGKYFRNKLVPITTFLVLILLTVFSKSQHQILKLAITTLFILYSIEILFYYGGNKNKGHSSNMSYTGVNFVKNGSVIFSYASILFLILLLTNYNFLIYPIIKNNQLIFSSILTSNITLIGLSSFLIFFPKDVEFSRRHLGGKKRGDSNLKIFFLHIFYPFDYYKEEDNKPIYLKNQTRYKIAAHLLVFNISLSIIIILLCFLGIILDTPHISFLGISSIIFFSWLIICSETVVLLYEGYICWEIYKSVIGQA